MATLVTLGFAGKSLETFVEALKSNGVQRLVDIRLRQNSQLSAFALGRDLAFLLPTNLDIEYVHEPLLAPTSLAAICKPVAEGDESDRVVEFERLVDMPIADFDTAWRRRMLALRPR